MRNPFVSEIARCLAPLVRMTPAEVEASISAPPNPDMGDYAFGCFPVAKALRKPPQQVTAEIQAVLPKEGYAGRVQAAGPYLNFFIDRGAFIRWLLCEVRQRKDKFGHSNVGAGKTLVVDYSSPNICKHLGIYHVRTTMIGHALIQVHRALGWRTVGINHLGDWGTQFGLLIAAHRRWGDESLFEGDAVTKLQDLYVRANDMAKEEPAMADEGRAWFLKLEQGDAEALALWRRFREVSLQAFQEVYETLGVSFDVIGGESLARDRMEATIQRVRDTGLAVESEGALVVDLSDLGMPPLMLLKRDGASRYETRDLATAEMRHEQYAFDKCLYVVGMDQTLYFRQLFEVLRRMGYPWAKRCVHVGFGMTRLGGERMRTRTGGAVKLRDVLAEAVEREEEIIKAKNPHLRDRARVARQVAIGSVIFHDLKRERNKNIDFDWDEVLRWEGDTGAYVQYAHARLCSILRRHGRPATAEVDFCLLNTPEDYALARKLAEFGDEIERTAERLEPFFISRYLLDLCALLSNYYSRHRVLGEDEALSAARVLLMDSVRQTIANGLGLLGVAAPEEM